MKRKNVLLIFAIMVVALFLSYTLLKENYTTEKGIKNEFYDNYDTILYLTKYLENEPYSEINIQNVDYIYEKREFGTWYVRDEKNGCEGIQEITDSKIVSILNELFRHRKYQVINKEDNTVSFQLWSNLDAGKGFAYVSDGNSLSIEFLTRYENIQENWYYYESNFNEWRLRNANEMRKQGRA